MKPLYVGVAVVAVLSKFVLTQLFRCPQGLLEPA